MPARHPYAVRIAAALALSTLATSACGARLTPEERTSAISQVGGGGSGGNATGASGDIASGDTGTGTTGTAAPGTTTGSTTGSTSGTTTGSTTGSTSGSTTGSGSATSGSTSTTGAATGGGTGDFRAAPPGGNGGATDVGITKDTITIYNISDVSGAVPGLFEDARFATQAYVKYFNARFGTIYGRKIVLKTLDSQLDSGANRSAALDLCANAFAGVGSVSAFDQGAADPEEKCKVPDIRGLATTDQMKKVPNVFAANAAGTGQYRGLAVMAWAASHPDAKVRASVKKAAYVYSDGEVTRQQSSQDKIAMTNAYGFTWIADEPFPTSSTDYTTVVVDMKKRGVEFVTFSGAYQQAAGIVKEMVKQDFKPVVWLPVVTAYTPNYLNSAGSAAEGTYVAVQPSLLEEIQFSPELQTYAQWLTQIKPDAVPTAIGQYAWAAAALFFDKMIKLGPKPTRAGLIKLVSEEHNWTANGLMPGQDVGGRRLSDCIQIMQAKGGKWVRQIPAKEHTWRCEDGVWDFSQNKKLPGFPR